MKKIIVEQNEGNMKVKVHHFLRHEKWIFFDYQMFYLLPFSNLIDEGIEFVYIFKINLISTNVKVRYIWYKVTSDFSDVN